jgi:anti-anti-sigma factor
VVSTAPVPVSALGPEHIASPLDGDTRITASNDLPCPFAVSVDFVGNVARLTLRGEFDMFSVANIDVLLDEMIAEGYSSVVVDLAGVDDMATAGLQVIAGAARRLAALDRKLTVRSPSAKLLHFLDATRLADLGTRGGSAVS